MYSIYSFASIYLNCTVGNETEEKDDIIQRQKER